MPKQKQSVRDLIASLDRLPARERKYGEILKILEQAADFYGFERIGTPLLDDPAAFTPLLKAGMFKERPPLFFKAARDREYVILPSASLSVLRAYASHKMSELPHPLKFMFWGERVWDSGSGEKGISSVFEWGLLIVGEDQASAEAEIIFVLWKGLEEIGAAGEGTEIRINAAGCEQCRSSFRSSLSAYFRARSSRLCKSCRRFLHSSPTLILRCLEERCRILASHAPQILDFLCEACKKHLRAVLEFLDEMRVPYLLDPIFFREGSWFSLLVFEITAGAFIPAADREEEGGAAVRVRNKEQDAILGEGGRMSKAAELIVSNRLDAALGVLFLGETENLAAKMGRPPEERSSPAVFLVELGDAAKKRSLGILETLRHAAIPARTSLGHDSIKTQLKVAEREGAALALILGQKEVLDGTVMVREMESGIQETVPQEKLVEFLKKKLKKG